MKAMVWKRYGGPSVLQLESVDPPTVRDGDILVRVRATTVTAGDMELRRFAFRNILAVPLRLYFGVFRPRGLRILGQELAGDVAAVGRDVSRFQVGDRVFAHTGFRFGGYAELASLPERGMVGRIPEGVSYEQAATIPTAGLYGLYFVRQASIEPGASVLILGGGGAIGAYALQLAKAAGAVVTVVDRGDKAEYVAELGADHFIDYQTEDFTRRVNAFDFVLDVIDKGSFPKVAPALKPGGRYLHTNMSVAAAIRRRLFRPQDGRRASFVPGADDPADLRELAEMMATGALLTPIDRRYQLSEIAEAHRYAETGAKKGHIVVSV